MNAADKGYREIVGRFDSATALESAISALASAGWDRSELSLLARHGMLVPDHVDADTEKLADDPRADREAVVSDTDIRQGRTMAASTIGIAAALLASGATIATGGAALVAIIGAAAAGGGAAAAVEAVGRWADSWSITGFLREQAEHGGILLWARLDRPEQEEKARAILAECGASHIHVHDDDDEPRPQRPPK